MLKYSGNKRILSNFNYINADINKDLNKILSSIKSYKPDVILNFIAQGEVRNSWKHPNHWYQTNSMSIVNLTSELYKYKFLKNI